MKRFSKFALLLLSAICLSGTLRASIIETTYISEVVKHLSPDTLIIFDIDNTLMEPVQEMGSDQWFRNQIEHHRNNGLCDTDALETALSEWSAVQTVTKMKLVEPGTDKIVHTLQKQGFVVMGLTTRGLALARRTLEQLTTVDIDLSATAPSKQEVFFKVDHGILYRDGVLFTAGANKGECFKKLFDRLDYVPKRVLFIEDKAYNINQVSSMCEKLNIPFVGLRYNYLDDKVAYFQKDVAKVQFEHFSHLLSNEEAAEILRSRIR